MFLIVLIVCLGIAVLVNGGYTLFTFISTRRGITHSRSEYIPTVTLLICAYNEEAVIAKKVENVARTNYLKEKLQVMFVNDHSSDRTREILDAEIRKIPFTTVVLDNEHDRSKPNALNFAFSRITTDIIVETDADSLLEEDAVRLLVENFADSSVGGANGEVRILSSAQDGQMESDERIYRKFYNLWRQGESNAHSISICNGPIVAFRTRLVKNIILNSLADDTELLFEIIAQGYRFVYDDRAVAYECTPPVLKERVKQKIRRCKGVIQVYTRNVNMLFNRKYDTRIFLPVILQFTLVPYCVVGGSIAYLGLLFTSIYWVIPLLLLIWPKFRNMITNIWLTHVIMAMSPFYIRKKWDVVNSSRQMLQKVDVEDFKQ